MMLDTFGVVTTGASLAAVVAATLGGRAAPLWNRTVLVALAGAWIGLVVALTASGHVRDFPVFVALFAASLIAAPFVWRGAASQTIVALNVLRLLGVSFLLLAYAGQLGGPFPYFAGIGDMITGAFALPIALSMRGEGVNDPRVLAWNAFGLLDLVVAVTLGVMSGNGSSLQVFHIGAGSAAIATLPWSLIPLVLVPVFATGHVLIFARAATARRAIAA